MLTFLRKNKYFLLGLLLILFVIVQNIFPSGYVFGGGDTVQLINLKENFESLFFHWESRTFSFYLPIALLDFLHVSDSIQLSFYLGIFLFGSYLSFYFFSKFIFPKISEGKKVTLALFYTLNLYTLFLFTGNWGYSYFPSIYIFIPILIGLFLRLLQTQRIIWGVWFVVFSLLGSSGFGNPAFLFSFAIFLLVIFLTLWAIGYFRISKKLMIQLTFVFILFLLINSFWLFPTISETGGGLESLQNSEVVEFNYWIRNTANPILKTFSLNHYSENYFPYSFYYKNFDYLKPLFLFLSFLPIILIFWTSFLKKRLKKKEKLFFFSFLLVLIVFTVLVARLIDPFKVINYYIYHLPGFVTLRGYDKTAIFIPFIISVLLLISLSKIKSKRLIIIFSILILATPLPFYWGKLQQTAGYRVDSDKNYQEASMSFLVKIPEEYYSIREKINGDKQQSHIANLPETKNDGSGIVDYPKWNFYGDDITKFLYNKDFIEANRNYFSKWSFTSSFAQEERGSDWIPKLLGIMSSKYILYHLDAPRDNILQSQPKINDLEKKGLIKNLEENEYFILYEINPDYFLPYITYQKETFVWKNDPIWIERNADRIIGASTEASMEKINPKKFEVDFKNSEFSNNIILSEKFHPLWKAYAIEKNGKKQELQEHYLARGWANGWKIENPDEIEKIIIEYYPTRLMWWGIWISSATVLFLLSYLLKYYYNRYHPKRSRRILKDSSTNSE